MTSSGGGVVGSFGSNRILFVGGSSIHLPLSLSGDIRLRGENDSIGAIVEVVSWLLSIINRRSRELSERSLFEL
jgi:hypothetical protein